jgi:hypothetical protein
VRHTDVLSALWLPALLAASEPVLAYRPFDSTNADVAAPGAIELEIEPLGYLHQPDGSFLIAPDVVVNFGLRDRMQLVLEGRYRRATHFEPGEPRGRIDETGLLLTTVVREGFLQNMPGASVAVEFGALLPTVNDEAGIGGSALVVSSIQWPRVIAHFNAELLLSRSRDVELFGGVILEGRTSGALRPVMELFIEGESNHPSSTRSILMGAIWDAKDMLALDFGTRVARVDTDTEYEVRAGVTWAFGGKT